MHTKCGFGKPSEYVCKECGENNEKYVECKKCAERSVERAEHEKWKEYATLLEKVRKEKENEKRFYATQIIEYTHFTHYLKKGTGGFGPKFERAFDRLEFSIVFDFTSDDIQRIELFAALLHSISLKPKIVGKYVFCNMKREHGKGFDVSYVKSEILRFLHSRIAFSLTLSQIKWEQEIEEIYTAYMRYVKVIGDNNACALIALSIVSERPIEEVNQALLELGYRKKGRGTINVPHMLHELSLFYDHYKVKGKTVRTLEKELPKDKTFLIFTARHVLAFKNGKVQDWTQNRLHRIQGVLEVRDVYFKYIPAAVASSSTVY